MILGVPGRLYLLEVPASFLLLSEPFPLLQITQEDSAFWISPEPQSTNEHGPNTLQAPTAQLQTLGNMPFNLARDWEVTAGYSGIIQGTGS